MKLFTRSHREPTEAERAVKKAQSDLERIREQTPAFRDLGARLRRLREQNHFADAIAATFRGEHP